MPFIYSVLRDGTYMNPVSFQREERVVQVWCPITRPVFIYTYRHLHVNCGIL